MKSATISKFCQLSALLFLVVLFSGCQEERNARPSEGTKKTEASAAAAMRPADNQGAPVPEGQALELLRFGPQGQVKKLNQVVAMFNQPMVALGDYNNVPVGVLTTDPPLEGTVLWLNQYTLAFVPKEPLTGSLDLTAKLDPAALKALSGASLSEVAAIEISLPEVAAVNSYQLNRNPRDLDQALRPSWQLTFNQPLDLDSLKAKSVFAYQDSEGEKRIPAEVEPKRKDDNSTFVFTAKEKLPPATDYRLVLGEGVKSLAGPQPGPERMVAEGATYGPLVITLDLPSDRPPPPEYGLSLNFSNPVDLSQILPLIHLDNGYDLTPLLAEYARPETPEEATEESAITEESYEYEEIGRLRDYLYLPGGLKAGTQYTLTVAPSARDIFGQDLGQTFSRTFTTGEYQTYLELGGEYGLLETASEPKLRLQATNIKEARIQGYALTAEEAVKFLAQANFSPYYYGNIQEAEQALSQSSPVSATLTVPEGARNGQVSLPVDLKSLFGDHYKERFLYLRSTWKVTGSDKKVRDRHTFAMVQVSDIGLAVKVGPDSSLVWATDLAKGEAWPGVELEILDAGGRQIWQGLSGEDGLAALPGSRELLNQIKGDDANLFVIARAAGQMALWNVNWNEGLETWRWNVDFREPMSRESTEENWLLNALPLYKPGETIKFKIISRRAQGDQLLDLTGEQLKVEVRDAQDKLISEELLEVGPFGTASHELKIPVDAALGHWSVQCGPADQDSRSYLGSFMVMTYRAPALEIKFEDKPPKAVAGEEIAIKAKADYHFGAPVAGQPVRYSVSASPADFRLPGTFSAYSVVNLFRPAGEDDEYDYEYSEPSVTVASDETTLDQYGRLSFSLNLNPAPDQRPLPRNYQTFLTVTDVDQRQVSANSDLLVHPADLYVGLHSDSFVTEAGQPYTLKAIAADPEGKLIADQKITATLYRRTWQNVRRKTAGAAYEYVSRMMDEKVAVEEVSSKGDLPAELRLTPEKGGYHWVLAEVKDTQGRINQAAYDFYVSGGGPVGWRMDNDDSLTLVPDKQEYRPGETAKIMVQSPFDQGRGLLTVERAGVRQSRVFKIENQTPVLEVALSEDDSPNVFVSVLLARGRIADKLDEKGMDFGKPAIRLGYVELKVPGQKDLLGVTVTPDLTEVGPGGEVEVAVAVTDHQGQPFSEAEVAIIAADAAVIQLGGESAYFPDRQFHQDRSLLVQTADNLISLIGRQSLGEKGGNPGGGGDDVAMAAAFRDQGDGVRKNFASLAWFEPQVKLDENGRATVKMKMPENLTTFKVYAVATGHGRLSGTGQNSVLVSRDLLARSALPGYAGVGDEFLAAMVVSNRGKNSGRATVKLAGENFDFLDKDFEKTVEIKAGESREVAFRVKAGPAAEAKFHFTVSMGQDQDSVEFAIPVSPANQLSTQASYERLEPGQWRTDLALTEGLDLGRGGVELELSPSLVGVLTEPFDWMRAYPHGCVEQTTSRAYASLVWLQLQDRLNGSEEQATAARRNVEDTIAKLNQWEQDGGYNTWPEMYNWGNRSVYLSAYVLDFLLSAREAGFKLPDPALISRIGGYLKKSLSTEYQWPTWYSDLARRETRSYVLAMLSRSGENVAAYVEIQYKKRAELSLFELINLVRTLGHQQRNPARAEQLKAVLPLMVNHIQVTAGVVQFVEPAEGTPEIWSSSVRTSALALIALCQTTSDHDLIPALARYMVSASRSGHFGSTQNNALALSALATYVKIQEPENPDLEIQALLGQTGLAQARFNSFNDPAVSGQASLTAIPKEDPAVVYNVEGQGRAWAALKIKTAPTEPDLSAASSGGFMLSRTFSVVAPKAGSPGVSSFKRGETVKVTVTMLVPTPRNNVVLLDRVPAGLEPVNFQLGDADLTLQDLAASDDEDQNKWGHWYDHQEIWPDRVAVYADRLSAGVYTFTYLARAVTVGEYLTPGPRAEEMYAPETFGRGEGQKLFVVD